MSDEQMDLSVLPAEIRSMIYSHLVYISSRRNKKFTQELQLTWFNMCFERALSATIFTRACYNYCMTSMK